ncbi:MAG: hypothetical protein K0U98_26205 [Deltaproteobacteria bacterium]|nr:hypothetical protein [Deltaproteobacteria bacterium]
MKRQPLRTLSYGLLVGLLWVTTTGPSFGEDASASGEASEKAMGLEAQAVFETLKGMEGTWSGDFDNTETGSKMEAIHVFEVSAAGTVVMETMAPGTVHEMINMYHLDGEDLMLTHYCAGGNQPQMRLDRETSTAENLIFDFTGGTNLDPTKDPHIHSARLELKGENSLGSHWSSWNEGKAAMDVEFQLSRQK